MCTIKIFQKGHKSLNTAQQQILLEEFTLLLDHGYSRPWTEEEEELEISVCFFSFR